MTAVPSAESLAQLVRPDSVHRSVYTDPQLFQLEMDRIFGRAWLYVGHDSQAAKPGDYFCTEMAGQPVIMVRHSDGGIRVLFNRCGHRGAKVAAERCGHAARGFVCAYHGWTYDTDGKLTWAPIHDGVRSGDFDLADPAYSMAPVPRVANYRGFVFASLAAEGEDFAASMGGVLSRLDDMVDRAPDDALEVAGGCHRLVQNSNWKLFVENTHDGLHPMSVHQSSVDASRDQAKAFGEDVPFALKVIMANGQSYRQMDALSVTAFDNGHSYMAGFRNPRGEDAIFKDYVAELERKKGAERAEEILSINCHNAIFYPNASVQPGFLQMRVIFPLAVDRTRIEMWSFRLKGAPDALFQRTIAYANTVHSPSSLIRPDDVEAYARVQEGLHAGGGDWVSQHRDFGRDRVTNGGLTATALSDLPLRNQFKAWLRYMSGGAA